MPRESCDERGKRMPFVDPNTMPTTAFLQGMGNDPGIELAKPIWQTDRETVFQGFGNSHFSHVEGEGFHVTTQVPGIPDGLSIHDNLGPLG